MYFSFFFFKNKNPIKFSLDFALIVFWFLVVGASLTLNNLTQSSLTHKQIKNRLNTT